MGQKIITMIKAQKQKGRYNVYLNHRYAFPISEDVMIKYRVFKGMTIDSRLQKKLTAADQVSKLYARALRYLSHRLRTTAEVKEKLTSQSTDQSAIQKVIKKLKRLKLIDDQNYANCYVRDQVSDTTRGPRRIAQHLKLKGVNSQLIQDALSHYYSGDQIIQNGLRLAKKLFHQHRDSFRNNLQKTKRGLVQKGYSFATTDEIMNRADFQPDPQAQQRLLEQEVQRAQQRYQGMKPITCEYKIKGYLYRKGFSLDAIDAVLSDRFDN